VTRLRCLLALAAFVALPLLAAPAQGQTAAVNTSLEVLMPPATGGGVRNLAFGSINPGGTSDTGPGSEANVNTAKWSFSGLAKNQAITLTITLPGSLTRGPSTLPITWPPNYGSWCSYIEGDACAGSTAFTPSAGTFNVTATTAGGAGNNNRVLDVWIGGRLSVPAGAVAGLYTATMTLTGTAPGM
jgi:hypothetical protein